MSFELWDVETRNLIETFESEDEALAAARDLVLLNPGVYPVLLALAYEDARGETTLIARGHELASLVGL